MAGNVGTGQAPRATSEESADGAAAWPGFEPTRRAKLAARTAGGRARRRPEHRRRSQQEHRWSGHSLVDRRLGPGTFVRYRARNQSSYQSSDTGVTP